MEYNKIVAILNYLQSDVDDIIINSESEIEIDGATYKILTDDEADNCFEQYQKDLWEEMGMQSFNPNFQEQILSDDDIIDKTWFDDVLQEFQESYCNDIESEISDNEDFENRLEQEISENGCKNKDEYIEYLTDGVDSIQDFKDNFGIDEFSRICVENSFIDIDKVIELIKEWDGRGISLASYDGDELDIENNFYAYRID